jgi:hypothetical protein
MRFRRLAVATVLATVVILPSASSVAFAADGVTTTSHNSDKSDDRASLRRFAVAGTVTAVDTTAGTVAVKLRQRGATTITIAVPSAARVDVNGDRTTLADVLVGYRIAVRGTRSAARYTATRVDARAKKATESEHS